MTRKIFAWFTLIIFVLILGAQLTLQDAKAQTFRDGWSNPIMLFEGQGSIDVPVIAADSSGLIHIFWRYIEQLGSVSEGNGIEMIYYTQWSNGGWTAPVDIFAAPNARSPSASVDANGNVHLVWSTVGALLKYSNAYVTEALSANGWKSPITIDQANSSAQITVDSSRRIHLVYAGVRDTGVYYLFSEDNGATWSFPVLVSQPHFDNSSVDYARIAVSENGTIHVVWTEFQLPDAWPPKGVLYSQSTDGGETWSRSNAIAGDGYDQIDVLVDDSVVHVAWNGMVGLGGRYHRVSFDNGVTWSALNTITTKGGTEGPPQMVLDSLGNLHLLTTFSNCAWYSTWLNDRWDEPICISGSEAMASNYIEQPALAISEGNQLHAIFWDNRQRLWYTSRQISAPSIGVADPFPTLIPTTTPTPTEVYLLSETPTPTPILLASYDGSGKDAAHEPGQTLLVAVIPVILVIGGFVLLKSFLVNKSRF